MKERILLVQVVTVLLASVALVVVAFAASQRFEEHTREAADYSHAAVNAALIRADVESMISLGSQEFVQALIASQGTSLSSVPVTTILEARGLMSDATQRAQVIEQAVGAEDSEGIAQLSRAALTNLDSFLASPTPDKFATFTNDVISLRSEAAALGPSLDAKAAATLAELRGSANTTRGLILLASLSTALVIVSTTVLLGRRLGASSTALRNERDALLVAAKAMDRRNNQFQALYHVVTEVTDSLNVRYVVETAIREARKLVSAELVVLRLLRGEHLVVAGIDKADDLDVSRLDTETLGSGLVGRAAKRGKTVQIQRDAASEMSAHEQVPGIESGIVVPLIVGARVVGTLGCWSRSVSHFSDDDERVLEMMASQVATAVAAADTYETSEKNANLDALTGLFNRRQLDEDLTDAIAEKVFLHQAVSVAMIDVDHFSHFNNDFGHKVGDVTLQKVAHVLKSSVREADRVYRYGGEEFLVIIDSGIEEAARLAERLRLTVADTPLTGEMMEPVGPVTISVGLATFPDHARTIEAVVEAADAALRNAKENGRNRVVVWTPDVSVRAVAG